MSKQVSAIELALTPHLQDGTWYRIIPDSRVRYNQAEIAGVDPQSDQIRVKLTGERVDPDNLGKWIPTHTFIDGKELLESLETGGATDD